jgi:hypothetical protein
LRSYRIAHHDNGATTHEYSNGIGGGDQRLHAESAPLAAHRTKMQQFLDRAEAGHYQLVYQSGDV